MRSNYSTMNTTKEQYDRVDFLRAWLAGQKYRTSDFYWYHLRVATAFCKAFHVDMTDMVPPEDLYVQDEFVELFHSVVVARSGCRSPFWCYLKAPCELNYLHDRHGEVIANANLALLRCYEDLLLDLLERIKGITSAHTVSHADLVRCGLPTEPAPNRMDYI